VTSRDLYDIAASRSAQAAAHGGTLPLADRLLWWLAQRLNLGGRIIRNDDGSPYLLRLYLTPHEDDEMGRPKKPRRRPAIFLHYFFRGDEDRETHSHPWTLAYSLILTRGYLEERAENPWWAGFSRARWPVATTTRRHGVFTVNRLRGTTFHRVLLDRGPCWTLFVAGPKKKAIRGEDWGFLNKDTGAYISWGERGASRNFLKDFERREGAQ
jgi:hypothetical protein